MKIAIYELVHIELISPLAKLFDGSSHDVTFFVSDPMKKDIEESLGKLHSKYKWVYKSSQQTHEQFLNEMKLHGLEQRYDIFLLNTVSWQHLRLSRLLKTLQVKKVIINVHSINNLFLSKWSFNFKTSIRHISKRILLKAADAFIVSTKTMQQYILENKLTSRPVIWLPPVVFNPTAVSHNNQAFNITVPGTIDERRRDYNIILFIYKKLLEEGKSPVLTLAGSPAGAYGEKIINECIGINSSGGKIIYFTEDIPEPAFQNILAESSVLLAPVNISFSGEDGISEIYGITKTSGNIHDALRYGKPLIVPGALMIPEEMESSTCRYDTAESLYKILITFIDNSEALKNYSGHAFENSLAFTKEKMFPLLKPLLDA